MASNARPEDFRNRARLEAERYGPDPWVFVRELLQNARDAGATRVRFEVSVDGATARVLCRDDGEGMSLEHARRYLFSLYASSKEASRDQVGRFGVGFWSILRFEPRRIIIRSRTESGAPWEMVLDGGLERAVQRVPESMSVGTEVVLERAAGDGHLARRVRDAAHQNARFLCTRERPDAPLEITVNGERVNAPFTLPAPSSSFRRGRVRGVVGLGTAARVELFSRGLRVRSASSLEEFVSASGRHTDRSRVQFAELPGRLAPQALLESDAIELVLSRSDARENRALRRLIRLAQRELERLVNRQIDAVRPLPVYLWIPNAIISALRNSLAWRMFTASAAGALLAMLLAVWMWGDRLTESLGLESLGPAVGVLAGGGGHGSAAGIPGDGRYRDLARYYRGPQVDVLDGEGSPIALRYTPEDEQPRFAALIFERFADDGTPDIALDPEALGPYQSATCGAEDECVHVVLDVDQPPGVMRMPVPTGHRLDVASVRLEQRVPEGSSVEPVRALEVLASDHDEPVISFAGPVAGVLRYSTTTQAPLGPPALYSGNTLPRALEAVAEEVRELTVSERVDFLVKLVRRRVRYSTEPEVRERHVAARKAGKGFIERTLEIKAGDCDMQNGLLVALLQHAHVPARLAVGFVGRDGETTRWLHAWVEYRDGPGPWKIADASESFRPPALELGAPSGPAPEPTQGEAVAVAAPGDETQETGEELPGGAAGDEGDSGEGDSEGGTYPAAPASAQAEPPTAPASPVETKTDADVLPAIVRWAPLGLGSGLALLILVVVFRERGTRRSIELDRAQDLSRLLQGAIQQPAAFRTMPAVFQRPLIPLASGKAISLERAKAVAGAGLLFRTSTRAELARAAIAGGAMVLDDNDPEGRTVADALGAVDLDEWSALIAGTRPLPLLDAINEYLEEIGTRWRVLASPRVQGALKSLDLAALRLGRRARAETLELRALRSRRVIVINEASEWIKDCAALLAARPRVAVFTALDIIVDRLELAPDQHARVLAPAAREALMEVTGR
ncbi:MAG: ATP-binding protein [Myxococcales bacterium]|nr:ATP-binding protein [Myxococcales bacterium]